MNDWQFAGRLEPVSVVPDSGDVSIGLVRLRPVGLLAISAACGGKIAGDINPAEPHSAY